MFIIVQAVNYVALYILAKIGLNINDIDLLSEWLLHLPGAEG